MKVHFYKYQATGNDFIIIDNRAGNLRLSAEQIQHLCNRKLGVGADGLMLLEKHPSQNFNLVYYNSDGSQSLCGNGSRAAVQMAAALGLVNGKATFTAYDGPHQAELLDQGVVKLKMNDVADTKPIGEDVFLNTGSPHLVRFVNNVAGYAVFEEGRKIRYSEPFQPGGTNVNFVELLGDNTIYVRTYERGVEDETLSCGTGVTAAALVASQRGYQSPVKIKTKGGDLSVAFQTSHSGSPGPAFSHIYLIGPAKMVFEGTLEL